MKTPWLRLAALLSCVILPGCVHSPRPAPAPPNYFDDAGQCDRQSQTTAKLPINLGALGTSHGNANVGIGPSELTIPVGSNREAYRLCMEKQGWKVDLAEDPYLALAQGCQQAARQAGAAEAADKGRVGGFDAALYGECLKNQGVAGTVTVLPVRPAPPE